jgi:hypothetical protein
MFYCSEINSSKKNLDLWHTSEYTRGPFPEVMGIDIAYSIIDFNL